MAVVRALQPIPNQGAHTREDLFSIALAGVKSPQNPYLGGGVANLGSSGGFEGMAINSTKDKLYTLLEKTVTGDPAKSLRINEFSIDTEPYTANSFRYALDA